MPYVSDIQAPISEEREAHPTFAEVAAEIVPRRASDAPPVVEFVATGNLGNRMIEFMTALSIVDRTPLCQISGAEFTEWGIAYPSIPEDGRPILIDSSQNVEVDLLAAKLQDGSVGRVVLSGYCQDITNFLPAERYRRIFQAAPEIGTAFGPDHLLISVRGAEVLTRHIRTTYCCRLTSIRA